MGIETYVADYLPVGKSPAKQIADHAWDIDVFDHKKLAEKCREEGIDGVLNVYLHICQIPYQKLCTELNLPCFASAEQYYAFTDKKTFLQKCKESGVDIIPQYEITDFDSDNHDIEYPVYVKPSDSRGTRGQRVCRSCKEVKEAISFARKESSSGEVIIERFMENAQDIQLTYFMMEGEPYLECIADKYNGTADEGYQGSVIAGICPSINEPQILRDPNLRICRMLKKLGLRNTPVFLQGFLDGNKLRLYDPALRLPGFLHERIMKEATGFDVLKAMISFALTGSFPPELKEVDDKRKMGGRLSVSIWLFIREGVISEISGIDEMLSCSSVLQIDQMHYVGDRIDDWRDIRNCFCEIAMLCDNATEAEQAIRRIYDTIHILDEMGKDMKIAYFDAGKMNEYNHNREGI